MAVKLEKGQRVSLEKPGGAALSKIIMGLGWDPVKKKGFLGFGGGKVQIDLDASCLLLDDAKQLQDAVWFRQLQSKDGSIRHTGDNLTGEGEGDDEQIIVDLPRVPENISALAFTVNSFSGQSFQQVENAYCRIVDAQTQEELVRYDLSCQGPHTALIMVKLYRKGGWKVHAIGETAQGRTFHDLLPKVVPHLG